MERKKPKIDFDYVYKLSPRLTERDKEIILAVHDHRFLRLDQLQRLFFPCVRIAQRRLKMLHDLGFLDRVRIPQGEGSTQYVYCLGKAGAYLAAIKRGISREGIRWNKRYNMVELVFLEHTLAVGEFYVELREAERRSERVRLLEWVPDREIKARFFRDGGRAVPDAYFKLAVYEEQVNDFIDFDYFLEVDMGTMRCRSFAGKIARYVNFHTMEDTKGWFESFPTLLITAPSESRLKTLKRATQKVLGANDYSLRCLFASWDRLSSNLFGEAWEKISSDSTRYSLVF